MQTAVAGVSGYAGMELARLLLHHPRLTGQPPVFVGREPEAVRLSDMHPQLAGRNVDALVEPFSWELLERRGVELLFLATPHEQSRSWVPEALAHGLRVVDLSGAWRLQVAAHRAIYGFADADAALAERVQAQSVYGLPELHRACIANAQVVANPGCYATSVILALRPLMGMLDLDRGIICDAKSGVSGAGKAPTAGTHFMYAAENLSAYAVFGHRHMGEMLEQLGMAEPQFIFTPHLLPISRGILSTTYVTFREKQEVADVEACFREFYRESPMVRLLGGTRLPQIQYSVRTNYCDIGFKLANDGRRCVVVSCLDNLLKGAAGQAVQNMNVMYGWDEAEGLA